ncbi:uncharacterized protein TrAFT101_000261 [Trichoderma asperellum]|uniref:uncharacterized protein n=2 Tax=Trichoderma asperellum TaxID=101201 RepID=UPI00332F9757|nr:hypothetical protein TrAFT101_000261 [Trichoderma asperellum]
MEIPRAIWPDAAFAMLIAVAVNLSYNFILASIRSNRASKGISRKPFVPQKFLTLRISNIPCSETNEERLHNILKHLPIEAQGIGGQPTVLGYSYSPTAVSSFSSRYSVATVTFEHAPAIKELETVLKQKLGRAANDLRVDHEFLGMTPLHNGGGIDARVDIIAVTGLAGHAFGSWKSKNEPHMWLRDFLRQSVPNTRIFTYGYDTKICDSQSEVSILELGKTLLESIKITRGKDTKDRPLIFIAHSLGGLVVKEALVRASTGNEADQTISRSCYALLFFGVPNRGLNNLSLMSMVKGQPNESLVRDLDESSRFLSSLHERFNAYFTFDNTHVLSISETKHTPTVEWCSETGRWERTGPKVMMVGHTSAAYAHQTEKLHDRLSINADHSEMVKFDNISNPDYSIIQDKIKDLVNGAPGTIQERFYHHYRRMNHLEKQFLRNLNAPDYKAFRIDKVGDRTPGTLNWFLNNDLYQCWTSANSPSGLWIQGSPGQGKTMLAKFILEQLEASALASDPPAAVIYFFFYDQDESIRTAGAAMRSLVKQLFHLVPDAFQLVSERLDIESSAISDSSLRDILKDLLQTSSLSTIYCVIDGLDECQRDESKKMLLELITGILRSSSTQARSPTPMIKILLTSRPTVDIYGDLHHLPTILLKANHDDLKAFINNKVHGLPFGEDIKQKAVSLLCSRVEQTFLWISIVLRRLERSTPLLSEIDLKNIIDESPSDLKSLFESIISQIKEEKDMAAQKLLVWAVHGKRPLKLDELQEAIAVQDDSTSKSSTKMYSAALTESRVTAATGVILEIIDGRIHLVHQSAKEFFLDSKHLAEFAFCMSLHPNLYLANICMTYLCFTDFAESAPCGNDDLMNQRHVEYPFLQYAARNWYRHLESRDVTEDDIKKFSRLISQLTTPKSPTLLTWGEVNGIANLEEAIDNWEVAVKVNIQWLAELQMDCSVITEEIIEKALANGMTEYDCLRPLVNKHDALFTERELCLVVEHLDHALVRQILSKQPGTVITQNVFETAAANVKYGRLVVEEVLKIKTCFTVTEEFIILAQKNIVNGKDIIQFIITNYNMEISTEGVRQIVAGGDTELVKLLFRREQLNGLQAALELAVGRVNYEMVKVLLEKGGNETMVTEKCMEYMVDSFDHDDVKRLLQTYKRKAKVTENIIIRTAKNEKKRKHLLLFFLEERGEDFQLTEGILKAIISTEDAKNDALKFLLEKRNYEIHMTEDIWKEAAANDSNGETVGLLLRARSHEFDISEEILRSAAENPLCGHKAMRFFLDARGSDIQIAERIVKETLKGYFNQEEIASLLSEAQRRGVLLNREDIMKAAAGTRGADAMKALLETSKHEIQITEEILKEVVRSSFDDRIMKFLLESKGNEIQITEEVLIEAARNSFGHHVLRSIFQEVDNEIQIGEEVLKAVVKNKLGGHRIIRLISEEMGNKITITEGVLIEAARNRIDWATILFILETYGDKIEITEEVLKATIRKKSNLRILSIISRFKREEVRITDEIKELMSEEQLECWTRPEHYLPPWLRLTNQSDE